MGAQRGGKALKPSMSSSSNRSATVAPSWTMSASDSMPHSALAEEELLPRRPGSWSASSAPLPDLRCRLATRLASVAAACSDLRCAYCARRRALKVSSWVRHTRFSSSKRSNACRRLHFWQKRRGPSGRWSTGQRMWSPHSFRRCRGGWEGVFHTVGPRQVSNDSCAGSVATQSGGQARSWEGVLRQNAAAPESRGAHLAVHRPGRAVTRA